MGKKKKRFTIVLSVVFGIALLLFIGTSCFIGSQVVAGSTQLVTPESTADVRIGSDRMNYDEFRDKYDIEKLELTSSFDGHMIPAEFISYGEKKSDTVILIHGLGGNRYTNYPSAELFLENGFNIITYDQRSSNENTAERTTFGYWEKYDTIDCIKYLKENPECGKIGIWGTSFGGATAVQAVAYEDTQKDISFMILDCPVSSMEWMVEEFMRQMDTGIPVSYMTWCGNQMNKLQLRFSYQDVDSAKAAEKISVPTFVLNSEIDEVTPFFMGKDIYESLNTDQKELWTVPDCAHTDQWWNYNEEYRSRVMEFIIQKD